MVWQIERISTIVAKHTNNNLMSFQVLSPPGPATAAVAGFGAQPQSTGDGNGHPEIGKTTALALAEVAVEELLAMAQLGEPIWLPRYDGLGETLNEEEYAQAFPGGLGPKMAGLRTEASRHSAIVCMDAGGLVEILMDVVRNKKFLSLNC